MASVAYFFVRGRLGLERLSFCRFLGPQFSLSRFRACSRFSFLFSARGGHATAVARFVCLVVVAVCLLNLRPLASMCQFLFRHHDCFGIQRLLPPANGVACFLSIPFPFLSFFFTGSARLGGATVVSAKQTLLTHVSLASPHGRFFFSDASCLASFGSLRISKSLSYIPNVFRTE